MEGQVTPVEATWRRMPDEPSSADAARWTRAVELGRVAPAHPVAIKLQGKHIALFLHQGEILACNNGCPHEGYPLVARRRTNMRRSRS
jgi:nitrite reductase/ring-hydroxylating ferredoxin subunit